MRSIATAGLVLTLMMRKVTRLARETGSHFNYWFMRADAEQLTQISELLESGAIVPVLDKAYPFKETIEAIARVESGHAVGKVVVVRD